jgi:hypothetical protein
LFNYKVYISVLIKNQVALLFANFLEIFIMTQAQLMSGGGFYLYERLGAFIVSPFIISVPSEKLLDVIKFAHDRKNGECSFKILDFYRQTDVQESLHSERIVLVWSKQPEQILPQINLFITKFIHPPSCSNYLTSQPICSGISTIFISILEHLISPTEYTLVIDKHFYNQFKSKFVSLSETHKWKILSVDMRIAGSMNKIPHIDFVIVDSPLNLQLTAIDIKEISFQAKCKNALVLVGSNALELYNLRLT